MLTLTLDLYILYNPYLYEVVDEPMCQWATMSNFDNDAIEISANEEEDQRWRWGWPTWNREACSAIRVEAPIAISDEHESGAPNVEANNVVKHSCPFTMWDDGESIFKTINDKKVSYAAKCIHCYRRYSTLSNGGTGHLAKNRDKYIKRREKSCTLSLRSLLTLMVVCVIGV